MVQEEKDRAYAYWLCCVPGIGNRTIRKLLQHSGSAREVYEGGETFWRLFLTESQLDSIRRAYAGNDPERLYEELEKKEISFLLHSDPAYPGRLRDIPDAPFALFARGKLPAEEVFSVAVVGARDCSEYGRYVASELGSMLGRRGVQVISGMARGIDGISQSAALHAGGTSFGVLGSGVDVCYPSENRALYDKLCAQGGILSIFPPGTAARPQNFPPRNRIVSGLADVLVVVEARRKSGTLITVDMALEQGRDVYVVPGRVTDRLSDGCNQLLRQGAGVFLSPDDFLEEAESSWREKRGDCLTSDPKREGRGPDAGVLDIGVPLKLRQLPAELQEIYRALDLQPRTLEEIQAALGETYSAQRLTVLLMRLCMEGVARQVTPGHFARESAR